MGRLGRSWIGPGSVLGGLKSVFERSLAILGRLEAVLERSWGVLGRLGAVFGRLGELKALIFLVFFQYFLQNRCFE